MSEAATPPSSENAPREGVVFAAVGARHIIMARRAARALRLVNPDIPIDLFTDAPPNDPIFAQEHRVEHVWNRPKIETLKRSRFERTLYLDSDIIAVADGTDLLQLLDKVDVVGVHDNSRNGHNARSTAGTALPNAFPSINSGVLAMKRNAATQDLLNAWKARMTALGHTTDQPSLRSLLWEKEISLAVAPLEYNLMHQLQIMTMTKMQAAPRFLHVRAINRLGRDLGDPTKPFRIEDYFSRFYCTLLRWVLSADETLPRPSPLGARPLSILQRLVARTHITLSVRRLMNRRYRSEMRRLTNAARRDETRSREEE